MSAFGTKRIFKDCVPLSAFGKADMMLAPRTSVPDRNATLVPSFCRDAQRRSLSASIQEKRLDCFGH